MDSGNNAVELYSWAKELTTTNWGKTLIIAPHQDDESLGSGGTIALLRQAGVPIEVVFVSDGSMSHPNSKRYPKEKLVALREAEALAALKILGVEDGAVHFMRLQDSQVPNAASEGFEDAVTVFQQLLEGIRPKIILVPWRRDPHKDHRATWQIVQAAISNFNQSIRRLEYLIWLWERGEADEFPKQDEVRLWKVDIAAVADLKQKAILAHTSQTTRLINDDPDGFILSPEVLAHFSGKYELFAEIVGG